MDPAGGDYQTVMRDGVRWRQFDGSTAWDTTTAAGIGPGEDYVYVSVLRPDVTANEAVHWSLGAVNGHASARSGTDGIYVVHYQGNTTLRCRVFDGASGPETVGHGEVGDGDRFLLNQVNDSIIHGWTNGTDESTDGALGSFGTPTGQLAFGADFIGQSPSACEIALFAVWKFDDEEFTDDHVQSAMAGLSTVVRSLQE